jgi:ABC-type sulfate/molybdate transport systems ATPase subunit
VQGASFPIERGESVTVMRAFVSGKTSVPRAIAGLDPISRGRILVDGVSISHDEEFVRGSAHRVLMLAEGRIRSITA